MLPIGDQRTYQSPLKVSISRYLSNGKTKRTRIYCAKCGREYGQWFFIGYMYISSLGAAQLTHGKKHMLQFPSDLTYNQVLLGKGAQLMTK